MGCDGGTIPRRGELVKVKTKSETKDKQFELVFKWRCCRLSQQVLQLPIVMCRLGHLYNKVALIESLLNRDVPTDIKHIKSLRNVRNLNLTSNPEYKVNDAKKEGDADFSAAPFICSVTGLEMTGSYRFIAFWSCGCVFSERAYKELKLNICPNCQMPFENEDVIVLNRNEENIVSMKLNINKQGQKRKLKKNKIQMV